MLWNKITTCVAVFVILLIWSWLADQKIREQHYTDPFRHPDEEGPIVHAHRLEHSHTYTFRSREYVKIIRHHGD